MNIINSLSTKLLRLSALFGIIVSLLVFVNYLTNNLIVVGLGNIDEKMTVIQNDCDNNLHIENGVLTLKNFIFKRGFGSCVENIKQGHINKIIIDDVYGGDVTETRILSKFIKNNNIPVYIHGACESSCLDLVLHSPQRMMCYDGSIGIHSYALDRNVNKLWQFTVSVKQDAMFKAFENTSINIDYIKGIMENTPSNQMFRPEHDVLISKNIIHKKIPCNSDFVKK